jgi:hypothetical protein
MNTLKKSARKLIIAIVLFTLLSAFAIEARANVGPVHSYNEIIRSMPFLPPTARVTGIVIFNQTLILNFSPEIMDYGGTYAEHILVEALLAHTRTIPGITRLTIHIDGKPAALPEGIKLINHPVFDFGD